MFQFIHAADIHLDSPLKGLMRYENAPVDRIRAATREAFRNLVQLAIDEHVAFVLIAGDLWDCDWPDSSPGLFFVREVSRLDKAGIPVYVIKGNHDAHSQLTTAIRVWPKNVTWFHHRKPQTVLLKQWNVAIHGQSYAQQHVLTDLSQDYPAPVPHAFNIGMLHTCLEDGSPDYAPACLEKLIAYGYDYWALGHIHDRQDLTPAGSRVHIEFPGNIQGRSIRETGPKGCTLVTVADDQSVATRFEPLDVVRWQDLSLEANDNDLESQLRRELETALLASEGRLLAVRLNLSGDLEAGQALRDRCDAIAVELDGIWIEKILVFRNARTEQSAARPVSSLRLELQEALAEIETTDSIVVEWMTEFARLRQDLIGDLATITPALVMNDRQAFRRLAAEVTEVLS